MKNRRMKVKWEGKTKRKERRRKIKRVEGRKGKGIMNKEYRRREKMNRKIRIRKRIKDREESR